MYRFMPIGFAAAAVLATSLAASAATVTFDFATSPSNTPHYETGNTLSFQEGGLDLDVSANFYHTPDTAGEALVTSGSLNVTRQDGYGLYVYAYYGDNHRIDGWYNEVVTLDFNKTDVSIKTIRFGSFRDDSEFDLFVGDGGTLFYEGSNHVFSEVKLDTKTSSLFAVGASEDWSSFKIKKVTVHVPDEDENEPNPVPLPAGGVLLLSGLGALMVRRRMGRAA